MTSTEKTSLRLAFTGSIISTIDSLSLTTIYMLFLHPTLQMALEMGGKFFLFPITIIAGIFRSIFACRQAYLDRGKASSVVMAVVETLTTVLVSTAIIGGLAAATAFALATPIIFAICFGSRTLFHLGAGIYYACQGKDYRSLAISHFMTVAVGTLITTAVICVFLLGKPVVAALGVTAGIIATGLGIMAGYQSYQALQKQEAVTPVTATIVPVKPSLTAANRPLLAPSCQLHSSLNESTPSFRRTY